MTNYTTESNIDFFSELYKSLDIEDNQEKDEKDLNLCLITNEELTQYHVEMNCGHKFNYLPLYKDIYNHKKKFNNMESVNLKKNEIRCPYCRKRQMTLLPYYEELGLEKKEGVNYSSNTTSENYYKYKYNYSYCKFPIENPLFIEDVEEGPNNLKYNTCIMYGTKISDFVYCNDNNVDHEKEYCYHHKKIVLKNYKLEKKNKQKEEIKKQKEIEKMNIKLEKQKIKEQEKINKQNNTKTIKKTITKKENVILSNTNDLSEMNEIILENEQYCNEIIKTGSKKGSICGLLQYSIHDNNNHLCKRHYNLKNKKSNEDNKIFNNNINI